VKKTGVRDVDFYRGTQRPPFPQTESQHNSFKVLCCGNFSQHNNLKLLCWGNCHNTTN